VYRGVNRLTGEPVVLKRISLADPSLMYAFLRERYFLSTIPQHPSLVRLLDEFFINPSPPPPSLPPSPPPPPGDGWLVYSDGGDSLRDFLYKKTATSNGVIFEPSDLWHSLRSPSSTSHPHAVVRAVLHQVLSAAAHLHAHGAVHRDIKREEIAEGTRFPTPSPPLPALPPSNSLRSQRPTSSARSRT
jgi:serine/threonine protein kinase